MSDTTTGGKDPHDSGTDDEQPYDTDAAVAIARDRLADELEPAKFGAADDVNQALAELAADLRGDDLTVHRLHGVCTHVELLYEALRDVSELHGWGWEADTDAHTTQQPAPDTEPGADPGVDLPDGLGDPTPPEADE